jgi:hypothetical protein
MAPPLTHLHAVGISPYHNTGTINKEPTTTTASPLHMATPARMMAMLIYFMYLLLTTTSMDSHQKTCVGGLVIRMGYRLGL